MVLCLGAHKKRILAVIVLVAIAVGAFFLIPRAPEEQVIPAATNEERVAVLSTFGWTVEEEPADMREVVIPAEFSDVYTAYNAMQNAQGFDLKPYAGETCTQYRYIVTNYPEVTDAVYATLLVRDGRLLGGDLSSEAADGFMHGFAPDSAHFTVG